MYDRPAGKAFLRVKPRVTFQPEVKPDLWLWKSHMLTARGVHPAGTGLSPGVRTAQSTLEQCAGVRRWLTQPQPLEIYI